MDPATLSRLLELRAGARRDSDWKAAFRELLASLRTEFIHDNVALYVLDARRRNLEVAFARAAGRGRSSEADTNWGEALASDVIASNESIERVPVGAPGADRLQQPYVLGLPVVVGGRAEGALVVVRFGGPPYSPAHRELAAWIAEAAGSLLEARALITARAELEQAQRQMRLQDDFVSSISHELRTPLGFIKGYTSSLLRQDTTWDEKTRYEFLSIIEEETDRLSGLIENMLESARLQNKRAKFKLRPVQLEALVHEAVARLRLRNPGVDIRVEGQPVPPIHGDATRLAQVLDNLLGNAVKYAPGSPLLARLGGDGRIVHFSLEDHGPGIPEEHLAFVFERFYRVQADASATGTGLGLYICRQIVLAHHGKIWVESVPDRGATFHIEIPIAA